MVSPCPYLNPRAFCCILHHLPQEEGSDRAALWEHGVNSLHKPINSWNEEPKGKKLSFLSMWREKKGQIFISYNCTIPLEGDTLPVSPGLTMVFTFRCKEEAIQGGCWKHGTGNSFKPSLSFVFCKLVQGVAFRSGAVKWDFLENSAYSH